MPISYVSVGYRPRRWVDYVETWCPGGATQVINYNGYGTLVGLFTECNPGQVELLIDGVSQFVETLLPDIMYPFEIDFLANLTVDCVNGGVGANTIVLYRYT